jgi:hypothetical protein
MLLRWTRRHIKRLLNLIPRPPLLLPLILTLTQTLVAEILAQVFAVLIRRKPSIRAVRAIETPHLV